MATPGSYRYRILDSDVVACQAGVLSGTMAAGLAADAEVFQLRWTSTTRYCAIDEVVLAGVAGSDTAFAAGFAKIALIAARAWTVAGTGGATSTITTNNMKLQTAMATTAMGSIRTATTAALGAGTKTLDATALGMTSWACGVVASVTYVMRHTLWNSEPMLQPIVLAANEGIVLTATVPATGTWQFGVQVKWHELLIPA